MSCRIVIGRGKNRGKTCGEVNRKCRHKNLQCPHCGIKLTVETSFARHQAQCNPTDPYQQPIIVNDRDRIPIHVKIKLSHTRTKTDGINDGINNGITDVLLEKIQKLERALEDVKNTPKVEHHHWNIVLGHNFFDELVHKMGKDHAVKFLTSIATEGKPVDVISKLYLEGNSPTNYPIACRDQDHFRYINAERCIIDDKGGQNIGRLVSSGVNDALLLAANETIYEQLKKSESMDYDHLNININIAPIQSYVIDMRKTRDHIISDLADITRIPNHPFFTDEDSFKIFSTADSS